jgi:hypothetical protein
MMQSIADRKEGIDSPTIIKLLPANSLVSSLVDIVEQTQPCTDQVERRQSITDQVDRRQSCRHEGGDTAQ